MNDSIADLAMGRPIPLVGGSSSNGPYERVFVRKDHVVYQLSLPHINKEAATGVINSGLQERLVREYYDDKQNAKFFVADDYGGIGVLAGVYLDMLSVAPKRQENGTGRALMESFLETTDGKLAFRSQPKRVVANEWYSKFAKLLGTGANVDGIIYNMYGVGLTAAEQEAWLKTMRAKRKNFK